MIDKNLIGHEFEAVTLPVEEGRLRFVAKSIGETNPVYSDPEAARKAGHPALPAPPTFVFMLEVDAVDLQDLVSFFGCKLGQLLHGEQGFVYHAPIYAGDRITVKKKVADIRNLCEAPRLSKAYNPTTAGATLPQATTLTTPL